MRTPSFLIVHFRFFLICVLFIVVLPDVIRVVGMMFVIEAFYNCPEFERVENIDEIYPHNNFNYKDTCFYPSDIPVCVYPEEYDILKFMGDGAVEVKKLFLQFKNYDVKSILSELKEKEAIEFINSETVISHITSEQLKLLRYKLDNDCMGEPAMVIEKNDEQGIDFFFDDTPKEKKGISPLAADLKKHIDENHIRIDIEELSEITCIPDIIKDILLFYYGQGGDSGSICEENFPRQKHVLKFEIIEEFIRKNDFDNKDDWSDAILEEYIMIKDTEYFPESVLEAFEDASCEIDGSLTLENIKEIKKIISMNIQDDNDGDDDDGDEEGDDDDE